MSVRYAVGVSLVVGLMVFGWSAAATAVQGPACDGLLPNETGGPGGELAGAIGDQESTLETELDDRRFEAGIENATTDDERAEVVAAELDRIGERVEAVETCAEALRGERRSGNVSEEAFRERVGVLETHVVAASDRLNETEDEADDLPANVRRAYDVDAERFEEVSVRVDTLRESLNETATGGNGTAMDDDSDPWPMPWR